MYLEEEKSPVEIAEHFSTIYGKKVQRNSIANFLRRYGLMRNMSESSKIKVKKGKIDSTIEKLIHSAKTDIPPPFHLEPFVPIQ